MLKYIGKEDPQISRILCKLMAETWKEQGPIVIAGIGGSGTRLVAEICRRAGLFLGADLNRALDNLSFTLLFRRYRWYSTNRFNSRAIQAGLATLQKMILNEGRLTLAETLFLWQAVLDYSLHYRKVDRGWALRRIHAYRKSNGKEGSYQAWGWKEPNSFLILPQLGKRYPELKFIHTIRHGLDMAFSQNQRQMKNWSSLFLPEYCDLTEYTPAQSFKYWIAANRYIQEQGQRLGPEHYLMINYDQLCTQPEPVVKEILTFTGLQVTESTFQELLRLPEPPHSLGRYKDHDLTSFDPGDLDELASFGFSYERGG